MKYFSMFSGIGGFELGIQNAYDSLWNQNRRTQPREEREYDKGVEFHNKNNNEQPICIGYSEIDKYAIQIYEKHFKPTTNEMELRGRGQEEDKLETTLPNTISEPNERQLTNSNYEPHHNFGDITKINADELPDFDFLCGGFPCQAFSIAGKRMGFEDTRGTLFFDIARILRAKQPGLLLLENVKGLLSHQNGDTFKTIITTLDELGYDLQWQVLNSKNFGVPQNRERVFIIGHLRGTSRPQVFPIAESSASHLKYSGGVISANTIDANYYKGINRNPGHASSTRGYEVEGKIRRLTPTECCRLQGFPDDWVDGISDTQKYKCLGNAVTVNVIQAIMEKLLWKNS